MIPSIQQSVTDDESDATDDENFVTVDPSFGDSNYHFVKHKSQNSQKNTSANATDNEMDNGIDKDNTQEVDKTGPLRAKTQSRTKTEDEQKQMMIDQGDDITSGFNEAEINKMLNDDDARNRNSAFIEHKGTPEPQDTPQIGSPQTKSPDVKSPNTLTVQAAFDEQSKSISSFKE